METTNEIIQRSNRDVVKEVVADWAVSKLRPGDGANGWQARAVAHGKMVLLGKARPELLPYTERYIGFASDTDLGLRMTVGEVNAARALLTQFLRRTESSNWRRRYELDKLWTRRQIRTLKAAVSVVVRAQFVDAAYSNGAAKFMHLVSCVKLLGQLAEFLPEPDRDLLDFLSVAPDDVRSSYFPWIDREVVEALA